MNLEERIAQLEFQIELLFSNTDIDRIFFETKITRAQYRAIMDLMDTFRSKLDTGKSVNHYDFESAVYKIVPEQNGNYHFCESIAKLFAENNQWDEVFPALYGNMPKYSGIVK